MSAAHVITIVKRRH